MFLFSHLICCFHSVKSQPRRTLLLIRFPALGDVSSGFTDTSGLPILPLVVVELFAVFLIALLYCNQGKHTVHRKYGSKFVKKLGNESKRVFRTGTFIIQTQTNAVIQTDIF